MIFQEKKTKTGYSYKVEDVFGEIEIESNKQIKARLTKQEVKDGYDSLDDIVYAILKLKSKAQEIKGASENKKTGLKIKYTFHIAPVWSDDDDDLCEDTHTSTNVLVNAYIRTMRSIRRILNWPRRFAGAFREAWKKGNRKY